MRISYYLAPAALAIALAPFPASAAPVAFAAQAVGRPAATAVMPFAIHLPLRNSVELERVVALQGTPGTQVYHHWLTPAQFRAQYGATPAQISAATSALHTAGISVDRISSQFITAHASVNVIERTFGAQMATFRGASGKLHMGSRVGLTLPAALRALNADVEGLVYHGEGHPMHHKRAASAAPLNGPLNRYGILGPLWFDDIKQAYKYPAYGVSNGTGVNVATVNEADFSDSDLVNYLKHEKVGNSTSDLAPLPAYQHALAPGAPPFSPFDDASFEANLDTQQVAGTAPGALLTGWTTDAFDFPSDFLQVYDYINETNSQDIVSTSYGECELFFTPAYNNGLSFDGILLALHQTFLQGNAQGITYTVSSGDEAGRACPEVGYFTHPNAGKTYTTIPSVDIPASDPNVVAVGGGNLITSSDPDNSKDLNSTYLAENAYFDPETSGDAYGVGNTLKNQDWGAGGGQSVIWSKPSWQQGITPSSTRSVPDVGLFVGGCFPNDPFFVQPCASDVTHAVTLLGGEFYHVIGTSVAAPEMAGMIATYEDRIGSGKLAHSGRLGNVSPLLYSLNAKYFHKSIPGNNGVVSFSGTNTWNPSYGLGSLFNATPFSASAGTPQTSSNP